MSAILLRQIGVLCLLIAAGGARPTAALGAETLGTVTVEAQRDRERLKRGIETFVHSAVIRPHGDESLLRWDHAVCPLVAGFAAKGGEFFLRRFSDNARAARVPLGPEDCKPDLYIVLAAHPAAFLNLWWHRNRRLFNTRGGVAPVRRFIETERPIRVWYNAEIGAFDGGPVIGGLLEASASAGLMDLPTQRVPSSLGSRITYTAVRNTTSAIVVIDANAIGSLNIGQLVDYVTMVSLLEIDLDKDLGDVPTILKLFAAGETTPLAMTPWDQALLRALYTTPQGTRMQLSQMESAMIGQLTAP